LAITFPTAYPANLTDAHWQQSKNKLDKLSKSGLGPLLKKAEADWKAVKWDVLKESKRKPDIAIGFLASLKADRAKAQALLDGPVKTAQQSLKAASEKAHKVSKQLTLSKGAADVAKAMSQDLHDQAQLLKGIKLTDFDQALTALESDNRAQDGIHASFASKVQDGLAILRTDPSFNGWGQANMNKKAGEVYSHILSAIQVGRTDFQARKAAWASIMTLTTSANKVIKGADAVADKKAIKKYVADVVKLIG
jgi:hypothetical protein